MFKSEILIYRAPATKSNSQKQFRGTIDISGLRDAVMTVFFHKISLALNVRVYFKFWPATCNLQITPSAYYTLFVM